MKPLSDVSVVCAVSLSNVDETALFTSALLFFFVSRQPPPPAAPTAPPSPLNPGWKVPSPIATSIKEGRLDRAETPSTLPISGLPFKSPSPSATSSIRDALRALPPCLPSPATCPSGSSFPTAVVGRSPSTLWQSYTCVGPSPLMSTRVSRGSITTKSPHSACAFA